MKQPPTKNQVLQLLDTCHSPGAKLAVGLAAFSGLKPEQVRQVTLGSIVELSLPKRKFSQVPARIELGSAPRRRVRFHRWYTFLSSRGCSWLLEDLETRTQPITAESPVVTAVALREADKGVHWAGFGWHDLRDFFAESFLRCFVTMGTASIDFRFLLGHAIKEDELTHVRQFSDPQRIEWMRDRYVQVEKQFFV
jgi:hypothetical protein